MINRKKVLCAALLWALAGVGAATVLAGAEPVRYDPETMSEPKVIHKVAPQYPEEAKKDKAQGTVILDAVIAEDGSIRETRVVQGEDGRLVEAARTAVDQWRYEPVRDESGKPMALLFTITIRFALS